MKIGQHHVTHVYEIPEKIKLADMSLLGIDCRKLVANNLNLLCPNLNQF